MMNWKLFFPATSNASPDYRKGHQYNWLQAPASNVLNSLTPEIVRELIYQLILSLFA
jgi:hypothetical protein